MKTHENKALRRICGIDLTLPLFALFDSEESFAAHFFRKYSVLQYLESHLFVGKLFEIA